MGIYHVFFKHWEKIKTNFLLNLGLLSSAFLNNDVNLKSNFNSKWSPKSECTNQTLRTWLQHTLFSFSHGPSLFAPCYLPYIRYGISLFMCVIFICSISLFIFAIRFSSVIQSFFFRLTHFCAVTNNELNAVTCSVGNRKIYSKKSLR